MLPHAHAVGIDSVQHASFIILFYSRYGLFYEGGWGVGDRIPTSALFGNFLLLRTCHR